MRNHHDWPGSNRHARREFVLTEALKPLCLALILLAGTAYTGASAQVTRQPDFVNSLMPQPAHLTSSAGRLRLSPALSVVTDHYHDDRLNLRIVWVLDHLAQTTGIHLPFHQATTDQAETSLVISVLGPGQKIQSVDEDEAYSLQITSQGAHLRAATDVGAIRGLETLLQLVEQDDSGYFLPEVSIDDAPRFKWRGLMMDCSRHFEPVDVIKRTLDAMAAVKMNVFHWHLTDDQGFRIESRTFPRLTLMGSDGLFYTQEQARDIVRYAWDRGIRVVPEFDVPGHTTSWMVGYPDLASAPGPFGIERHFGIFNPVMDPTRESTYVFLDKFLAEMVTIFPDQYVHIGGDENNGVEWKENPRIQAFMREHKLKDTAALQRYFNQRLVAILARHGKLMIGWDEIFTPGLPKSIVVESWRGSDSLVAGARQGYSGVLSAGYYLGHMDSAEAYYQVDPLPPDADLPPEVAGRVLGGEACIWGEYVDAHNIDSRVWPITAAMAERFWSPQTTTDINDMYRRLSVESLRLERLHLTHLTQEDESLRALAGTEEIAPLRTLAGILEPVIFNIRGPWSEKHGVTQQDPQNHLIDALPPDPESRHLFDQAVQTYLQNPRAQLEQKAMLTTTFRSWVDIEPQLMLTISASPRLAEARPRALELAELGSLGLEVISYLSTNTVPPVGWKTQQLAVLDKAAQPEALVRFTVLKPLHDLVDAVRQP